MSLSPAAQKSLAKWYAMIANDDLSDLASIVAEKAIFRSPMAYPPYPTRDVVCLVLRTAASVFEDFVYHREFAAGPNDVVLEFSARVGDKKLKGVDIIRFDEAGRIAEFEVMVRPANALAALGQAMGARIGPVVNESKKMKA
jgi:SnoaL-like domain